MVGLVVSWRWDTVVLTWEGRAPRIPDTGATRDAGGGQQEKVPRRCWDPRAPGPDPDPWRCPTGCFGFSHNAESATPQLFSFSAGLIKEQNLSFLLCT